MVQDAELCSSSRICCTRREVEHAQAQKTGGLRDGHRGTRCWERLDDRSNFTRSKGCQAQFCEEGA